MPKSKLIAVNGPPGSGKTTLALKLAQEIHQANSKFKVLYLSPDTLLPAMPMIFPRREKENLHSLGAALDNVELSYTDFLGVLATTSAMSNLGYMGYIAGEGPYSHAVPQENKIMQLFHVLKEEFDYIVVDCDRNREDLISSVACGLADHLIQIINADIKSVAYYGFEPIQERAIQVLNLTARDVYLPIQETKDRFPGIKYTVLYSRKVKMQMFEGELMDFLKDRVFRKSIKPLVELLLTPIAEDVVEELPLSNEQGTPLEPTPEDDFWR